MRKYEHEILTIIVPSSSADGTGITRRQFDGRIAEVNAFLSAMGGFTDISGRGGWIDDDDKLISENVAVSFAVAFSPLDYELVDAQIAIWRDEWAQDCILRFVSPCNARLV